MLSSLPVASLEPPTALPPQLYHPSPPSRATASHALATETLGLVLSPPTPSLRSREPVEPIFSLAVPPPCAGARARHRREPSHCRTEEGKGGTCHGIAIPFYHELGKRNEEVDLVHHGPCLRSMDQCILVYREPRSRPQPGTEPVWSLDEPRGWPPRATRVRAGPAQI